MHSINVYIGLTCAARVPISSVAFIALAGVVCWQVAAPSVLHTPAGNGGVLALVDICTRRQRGSQVISDIHNV